MNHLGVIIERNAACWPHKVSIVFDGRRITFADHAARAHRLASALYGAGVRRSDRVAFLSMNNIE